MNAFNSAFTLFLSLMVEAMPFLIIGVLFSGLLQYFVKEECCFRCVSVGMCPWRGGC
jgi:uncharacterized membrane protein YraQ (UPF0718 family)